MGFLFSFQGWTTTCKITSHRASTKYTSYPAPNLCFPSGLHRACTSTITTANLVLRALSANSSHQFQGLTRQDTPSSYQPRAGEVKSLTGVSACSRGSCYRVNESHVSKIPPSKRASAKKGMDSSSSWKLLQEGVNRSFVQYSTESRNTPQDSSGNWSERKRALALQHQQEQLSLQDPWQHAQPCAMLKSHPLSPSMPSLPSHHLTSHSTPVAHFLTPGNWNKGRRKLVSKGEEGEEGKSSLVWEAEHSECCPCISYSLQNPFVMWLPPIHMPGTTTAKGLRNATACCVAMGIRRQAVNW